MTLIERTLLPAKSRKKDIAIATKYYGSAERLAKLYSLKICALGFLGIFLWGRNIMSFVLLFLLWYKFVFI